MRDGLFCRLSLWILTVLKHPIKIPLKKLLTLTFKAKQSNRANARRV